MVLEIHGGIHGGGTPEPGAHDPGQFGCAVAINGILVPHHFFGAGFTGVSLVIHYLAPFLPIAVLYFMLNVPLFALGWMYVGRRFFLYSIAGMLIYSGALACTHVSLPVYDKLLSALLAGIIMGMGSGIMLRSLGSGGANLVHGHHVPGAVPAQTARQYY